MREEGLGGVKIYPGGASIGEVGMERDVSELNSFYVQVIVYFYLFPEC